MMMIMVISGCAAINPGTLPSDIDDNGIMALSTPIDAAYRPCRLSFVHRTEFEETDNAIVANPGTVVSLKFNRVAYGTIEAAAAGSGLNWRMDVARMGINGNPVSHRQSMLSTGEFTTDSLGCKTHWEVRLPAYEETGASRFFSSARMAGLKSDARHLADDLVPRRLGREVGAGGRLMQINVWNLPDALAWMGIEEMPTQFEPMIEGLVLMADGWSHYQDRRVLTVRGQQRVTFDTQNPPQHHRLAVKATCLLDGQTFLPVAADVRLDLETTYLSYRRMGRFWKRMDFEELP
jgi:hypothetical protein